MPHKRKNAKAARSAPEGFSLAFLQQCGMGNKARSEEISFGGRKKILKFLSDLIGATPTNTDDEQSAGLKHVPRGHEDINKARQRFADIDGLL